MYIIYSYICKMLCIVFLQYNEINASTYCEQFCIKFNKRFSKVIR